jgi:hypothetical protein
MESLGYGKLGIYNGAILPGAPQRRIDKLAGERLRLPNVNVEAQCPQRIRAMGIHRCPAGKILAHRLASLKKSLPIAPDATDP